MALAPKTEASRESKITLVESLGFEQLINNSFDTFAKNLVSEYLQYFVLEVWVHSGKLKKPSNSISALGD